MPAMNAMVATTTAGRSSPAEDASNAVVAVSTAAATAFEPSCHRSSSGRGRGRGARVIVPRGSHPGTVNARGSTSRESTVTGPHMAGADGDGDGVDWRRVVIATTQNPRGRAIYWN